MKDKLYRKLNKNKPSRRVLDSAYAEMREQAESKKRRPIFKWALSGAMSVLVIVVAVIVALNNPLFKKTADSPNSSAPESSAPPTSSDGTLDAVSSKIVFQYPEIISNDGGAWYSYDEETVIKLYENVSVPNGTVGEKIIVESLNVNALLTEQDEKTMIYFTYEHQDYLVAINTIEAEVVEEILKNIK